MLKATVELTDELLVAYVDDELDAAQRDMVRGVLDGNSALCRRADEMRLARDLLCEAFPLQSDAIVPARIEVVAKRLAAAAAGRAPNSGAAFGSQHRWGYAIAAGFMLCAVAAVSYFISRDVRERAEDKVTALTLIDPGNPLHAVLEASASAELIQIPKENAAMRAVLTFRTKEGRYCREFEILAESGDSSGIACREQEQWRIEVLAQTAAVPSNGSSYTPASSFDSPPVTEVFDRLVQGEAFSARQEMHLLTSGWRTTAADEP